MVHTKTNIERVTETGELIQLEIAIHLASNGTIVLNYPGITGDIDGYNNKYGQLADFVQERGVGTVIRMGNKSFSNLSYPKGMIDNFRYLIDYAIKNSYDLCDSKNPKLYLMGFSAGASVIAAIASDYSQVDKILLMAPSGDVGQELVTQGLGKLY